jgi:hypothetical protein
MEIKATNPVGVANYVINNQINDEPAFDWCVKDKESTSTYWK